jgi:hypothetical protein
MQRLIWMTVIAGTLSLAGVAGAAPFAEVDANGDGAVSQEEFASAYPDAGEEAWTQIDANADGQVTEDEHQAAVAAGVLPAE